MQRFFKRPVVQGRTVIYSKGGPTVDLESASSTHGGFDNDIKTLNSTLRIMRGSDPLMHFEDR